MILCVVFGSGIILTFAGGLLGGVYPHVSVFIPNAFANMLSVSHSFRIAFFPAPSLYSLYSRYAMI
ncbi:MAG: hypothetical protein R6V50_05585 [Thermoplasmatota archaeon]